jgi:hypothetical protein
MDNASTQGGDSRRSNWRRELHHARLGVGVAPKSVNSSPALPLLPFVLSVIAGCTDVISFLGLGGLFTARITGNLVILAAHVVRGEPDAGRTDAVGYGLYGGACADEIAGWRLISLPNPSSPSRTHDCLSARIGWRKVICSSARAFVSAYTDHPALDLSLNSRPWFSWQLEDCSLLILSQRCQEHDVAIRKFQRIVMGSELVFVDLPKDRSLMFDCIVPRPQFSS